MESAQKELIEAWEKREGPAVLATVGSDGAPNIIYVGEIQFEPELGFVVADNYFHKTRQNIKNGSSGAVLFLTDDRKAFQIKGSLSYHTKGPVFESMKKWHNPKHPGCAATVIHVENAYSGAEQLF